MATHIIDGERMPHPTAGSGILRKALFTDAAACGLSAVAALLLADQLGDPLGMSPVFLRWAGVILVPFTAALLYIGRQPRIARSSAVGIIAFNALWVVASVAILVFRWIESTAIGYTVVIVQAIAVACLAAVEWVGLRRGDGS